MTTIRNGQVRITNSGVYKFERQYEKATGNAKYSLLKEYWSFYVAMAGIVVAAVALAIFIMGGF